MKTHVRIIGDVHGLSERYLDLIKKSEYSLQIGDMGFNYEFLNNVDPLHHKFIGGNHDNYDVIEECDNALGDFGVWSIPTFGDVFFVRGAWSIDWKMRTPGVDFWPDEELSMQKCAEALELYTAIRPKMIVTHGCPLEVVQYVTNPIFAANCGYTESVIKTRTSQLLQAMTEVHRPKIHIFGHFHVNFDSWIDGTRYICLGECEVLDFPKKYVESL